MNEFKISVIIPTKDRAEMLPYSVASIWSQTVLPQEIIIINDASTVDYEPVIEKLQKNLPLPIVYKRIEQSLGPSNTRNTGVNLAKGDILMFLDDDDTWLPHKIANQLQIFEQNPKVGLVYSARQAVDEAGNLLFQIAPKFAGNIYREMLQKNHVGITSSVAVKRELFLQAGGFDVEIPVREDYELWLRLSQITAIAFDPEATVKWTVHSQPRKQTSSKPEVYERAVKKILQKYQPDINALPFKQARLAYASHYTLIADKYLLTGSPRKYWYVLRSLLQYPSVAALARLLPYSLYLRLRKNT